MKFKSLLAAAAVTLSFATVAFAQEEAHTIQVGQQATGTFSWITHAIDYYGLDEKYNLNIVEQTYASKPATQLAIQAGEVDVGLPEELRVTEDPDYSVRAWMAVVTYLLSDYNFVYE